MEKIWPFFLDRLFLRVRQQQRGCVCVRFNLNFIMCIRNSPINYFADEKSVSRTEKMEKDEDLNKLNL